MYEAIILEIRTKVYKNENDVKEVVRTILSSFPTDDIYHFPYGATQYGVTGGADRLCCFRGYFIAIEVKYSDRPFRPGQRGFLTRIGRAGGLSIKVNQHNLQQLYEALLYVSKLPFGGIPQEQSGGFDLGLSNFLGTTDTYLSDNE